MTFPAELRRYRLTVLVASLLLAAVGVAALAVALAPSTNAGNPIPYLLFAAATLPVALFGLIGVPRWYRRAGRIVAGTPPRPALASLRLEEGSDSTALYAEVRIGESAAQALDAVALLIPAWDVGPLLGGPMPVGLYVDPERCRLVAIAVPQGMLWCLPPGRIIPDGSPPARDGRDHPPGAGGPGGGL
ncbi:hypothetical protein [Cyanobium sp. NIES-981]|uniref:hypothetical protein n=1 Tax=Cyanobium sp. NIES-981 TaxID=1851505 RepID=UPI0007DDA118|nr:hypothetical protein [Cyanobium sp. NIES-981]SBO42094.1 protein of unknown function [Cyanobium sp. NIES-981]